jgi:hypothetical protein
MKRWYRIDCIKAHEGAGKHIPTTNYVYVHDASEALERYRRMPGVKRSKTPNIRALTEEESGELEEKIKNTPGVGLEKAKKEGYYGRRD